jgi:MinD-like ATPase involved in chromosome partitioning or flagellar assembly
VYVVTFYSFKGGVGRSMALVNVGAELARLGSRVLLVDFDLEAPSLTSFNLAGPAEKTKGLVDFVLEYLNTNVAPRVEDFIYESESFPQSGGRLWIMPAGRKSADYPRRLTSIHWKDLYENRSGYLLMEDLKAQWKEYLEPDYVLIDSRTGHSEVLGICTRQLPDAVCAVFTPNKQNLDGLEQVVKQIRAQGKNGEGRDIRLHFVVSNVPNYDDEKGTLAMNLADYKERLAAPKFDQFLHLHPHLALLGQEVAVLHLPKISLCQEYRDLVDVIREHNLQDRNSALKWLNEMAGLLLGNEGLPEFISQRLDEIARLHAKDGEVCFWLARVKRQLGATEEAVLLLTQSIEQGYTKPQAYLQRASLRLRETDASRLEEARKDLHEALSLLGKAPNYRDVVFAVRSLVRLDGTNPAKLAESDAVRALSASDQLRLGAGLDTTTKACQLAYYILRHLPQRADLASHEEVTWRNKFSLPCIHLGQFVEALEVLRSSDQGPKDLNQTDAFNVAMAQWALNGVVTREWFARTLEMHKTSGDRDANYYQCLALSAWACSEHAQAQQFLLLAKQQAASFPSMEYSAWRYLRVNPVEFSRDLERMSEMFEGKEVLPDFIRKNVATGDACLRN